MIACRNILILVTNNFGSVDPVLYGVIYFSRFTNVITFEAPPSLSD